MAKAKSNEKMLVIGIRNRVKFKVTGQQKTITPITIYHDGKDWMVKALDHDDHFIKAFSLEQLTPNW